MKKGGLWNWTYNGIPVPYVLIGLGVLLVLAIGFNKFGPKIKEIKPLDASISIEDSATLVFENSFSIKKWNDKKTNKWIMLAKSASIKVPKGINTFEVNFSDGSWKAKNISLQEDFQPGLYYKIGYNLDKKNEKINTFIAEISQEEYAKYFEKSNFSETKNRHITGL